MAIGCFGNDPYDNYLERLVDEHNSSEEEEDDPRDEYFSEDEWDREQLN